jgi:hypothetical protein
VVAREVVADEARVIAMLPAQGSQCNRRELLRSAHSHRVLQSGRSSSPVPSTNDLTLPPIELRLQINWMVWAGRTSQAGMILWSLQRASLR